MDDNEGPTIDPSLVRQLLLKEGKGSKKISKEATQAASELLRLFVLEARNRSAIEAECEDAGAAVRDDDDDNVQGARTDTGRVMIRADHINKIAAELLMDFS